MVIMKELDKGKNLLESGNFPKAIEVFSALIEEGNFKVESHFWRATAYLKMKDYVPALADLDKSIHLFDEYAEAYSLRGVVYFHLKKSDLALQDMNKALDLEPENPYRYSSRAYIRASMGDVLGGIEDYEKTIELDPEDSIAYNNLGLLQESLGYKSMAQSNFKKTDELIGRKETDWSSLEIETPVKKESIPLKKKESLLNIFLNVFTSKKEFNNYLQFLKSIFITKKA